MNLVHKPKEQQVRMFSSDDPGRCSVVQQNPNKVFVVVGPFSHHDDKADLMRAIEMVVRGYNLEQR